jgi:SAM-dependent methyltransferase
VVIASAISITAITRLRRRASGTPPSTAPKAISPPVHGSLGAWFAAELDAVIVRLAVLLPLADSAAVPLDGLTVINGELAVAVHVIDQSADLVLLANIWHELDSLDAVLKEPRRMLKSGGRLAILDWQAEFSGLIGPPQERRISDAAVCDMLRSESWVLLGDHSEEYTREARSLSAPSLWVSMHLRQGRIASEA